MKPWRWILTGLNGLRVDSPLTLFYILNGLNVTGYNAIICISIHIAIVKGEGIMFVFTENCELVNLDNATYVGVASSTSNTPCIRASFGDGKKQVDIVPKCKNMIEAKEYMKAIARAISEGKKVYNINNNAIDGAEQSATEA